MLERGGRIQQAVQSMELHSDESVRVAEAGFVCRQDEKGNAAGEAAFPFQLRSRRAILQPSALTSAPVPRILR